MSVRVALGADATITDTEHDPTPAGWARHDGHTAVADYPDHLGASPPGPT